MEREDVPLYLFTQIKHYSQLQDRDRFQHTGPCTEMCFCDLNRIGTFNLFCYIINADASLKIINASLKN